MVEPQGRSRCRRARRRRARRPAAEPDLRQRRPARRRSTTSASRRSTASRPARCRSWRRAPTTCSGRCLTPDASCSASDGAMIATDRPARRRHRHAGRRVPRPVDDDLRAGRRPDRAAPARRRARGPAQHGLSGHDGATSPSTSPNAAAAPTSRSVRSASPRATPSRSCATLPQIVGADTDAAAERAEALFARHRREDHPDVLARGRAREAVHEHVAVHEVRGRQPVPDDRGPGRRRLHERPAGDPRGLPAGRRPAGARLRRRSVPVQGHDAARGVHRRPLPARPGRDAGQRGPAGVHRRRRWSGATAAFRARPSASWAWPSRASPTTPGRR